MPAIHAGMTKISIFMFLGDRKDHEPLRGGEYTFTGSGGTKLEIWDLRFEVT
jgi:hypothetical protein